MKKSVEFETFICNEYKNGKTIRELSRQTKSERRTIQHILLRNKIEIKGSTAFKNIPIEIQESIKNDFLSLKYHTKKIAEKYNLSFRSVNKIAAKFNITEFKKQESTTKIYFHQEQIQHIIESYGKTETLLSLSKIYKCSRTVIKQLLIENNIKLLERKISNDLRQRNKYIKKIIPTIINNYLNNKSIQYIKEKYKMSYEKIIEILIKNKIKLKPIGFYRKIKLNEENLSKIISRYNNGETLSALSIEFNLSYPTALSILRENNVNLRGRNSAFLFGTENFSHRSISGKYKKYFFRSMNELSFIVNYLEKKNIEAISGEKTKGIKYFDQNNKKRTYFPDFITNKFIFEIKPKHFWLCDEVILKSQAAIEYANKNNLKFRLVKYPVIIKPILNKYFNNEIKFTKTGLEKFTRIYKQKILDYQNKLIS